MPATPRSARRVRASVWGLCAAFWLSGLGLSRAPLADVPPLGAAAQTQPAAASATFNLPNRPDSLKFFVLGDFGDGSKEQYELAAQMARVQAGFPALLIITVGDNIYGSEGPKAFSRKFDIPYKPLLDAGVKFYAALGNHDTPNQRNYKEFNMGGKQYYTFRPKLGVRFFALDSNYMSPEQLTWLENELKASGSDWKIAFFHHPLYSSGSTHGSADLQRGLIEPVFMKYGVNVVFTGHEHFYERIKPQKGVAYFIIGSSSKLRHGDLQKSALTLYGNDSDYAFMLVEIDGDELFFQTISDKGVTLDAGSIRRAGDVAPGQNVTTQPVVPQTKPSPVQPGPKK